MVSKGKWYPKGNGIQREVVSNEEWYPTRSPSGPQSVIWFLALNSYSLDSASVVASAWIFYYWSFQFCHFTLAASSQGPRRNSLRVARTLSKSSSSSINVVAWMCRSSTSPLLYAASALKYQDGARFAKACVSIVLFKYN